MREAGDPPVPSPARSMSYLPEGATFEERVQDYFLALRGSGLMLSALDGELLGAWARSGAPFEVIARGIRRSAEKALFDARPGEPILRSLRACKRQVEAEIEKHLARSAGAHEKTPRSFEALRKSALVKLLREAQSELGLEVGRLEQEVASAESSPDAIARLEDVVYVGLCRALPFAERRRVWREATSGAADSWSSSRVARVLGRRVRLAAAVKRRLGVA